MKSEDELDIEAAEKALKGKFIPLEDMEAELNLDKDVGKVKINGTGAAPLETAASIVVSVNAIGANALFERHGDG